MKKLTRLIAALLTAALLLCGLASAVTVVDPTSAFYVADYADILSDETEAYILRMNDALYEQTGGQIVVVTVEFLGGQDIEEYAFTLMNEWKIGSSENNNGLLLLLVTGEANFWAVSGSGIQAFLTPSLLAEYLNTYLEPDFEIKNYDAGVMKTFDIFLGWYQRFYKISLTDSAESAGTEDPLAPKESDDPLSEDRTIKKGGIIGKIAGIFLVVVLAVAVLGLVFVAVPRFISMRRKGYRTSVLSRSFWSSNPPPPPSRTRTVSRTGNPPPRTMPRMGSGGTPRSTTGTGTRSTLGTGSRSTLGTGSRSSSGSSSVRTVPKSLGTSSRTVGSGSSVSRPRMGGGGVTRGGGVGRSSAGRSVGPRGSSGRQGGGR